MGDSNLRHPLANEVWNLARRRIARKDPVPPIGFASNRLQICADNLRAGGDESGMPVFDFPRITILPDPEGRKVVRATVVNQRTCATMTV